MSARLEAVARTSSTVARRALGSALASTNGATMAVAPEIASDPVFLAQTFHSDLRYFALGEPATAGGPRTALDPAGPAGALASQPLDEDEVEALGQAIRRVLLALAEEARFPNRPPTADVPGAYGDLLCQALRKG